MTQEKSGGLTVYKMEKNVTSNSGGAFGIYNEFGMFTGRVISILSKSGDYYVDVPYGAGRTGIDAWCMIRSVSTGAKCPNTTIGVIMYYTGA